MHGYADELCVAAPVLIRFQGHGLQHLTELSMQALQHMVHHKPEANEGPVAIAGVKRNKLVLKLCECERLA